MLSASNARRASLSMRPPPAPVRQWPAQQLSQVGTNSRQVDMDAKKSLQGARRPIAFETGEPQSPPLGRRILCSPRPLHQLCPGARNAICIPAGLGRLGRRRPKPGNDGQYRRSNASSGPPPCAVGSVSRGLRSLSSSSTEPGQPLRHDQRQGHGDVFRANVDEVNVHAVDRGHETEAGNSASPSAIRPVVGPCPQYSTSGLIFAS